MTNYDKHKGEILKLAEERYSDFYAAEALAAHDISGLADADNVIKWLFGEYEAPLLKNGDDLKPGDWIMVRNCDTTSWEPRIFMCYNPQLDRSFVTMSFLANWYSGGHECWRYARLPMEGE